MSGVLPKIQRWLPRVLLLGLLVMVTGCMKRAQQEETIVYYNDPFVLAAIAIVCVLALPLGALFIYFERRNGLGYMMTFASVGWLFMTPGLFLERITISPERFCHVTGQYWRPTTDIAYDEIDVIHFAERKRSGRRGTTTSYTLDCELNGGELRHVSLGNKEAILDILRGAVKHDIEISGID